LRSAESLFPPHAGQRRAKAGLDVLLTKAAIDFQNLANEHADALVRLNLEALREAAGLDALLIASFDSEHTAIEHVVGVTGLFATFNPETLRGESLDGSHLRNRLEHLRVVEIRDTSQPRPISRPKPHSWRRCAAGRSSSASRRRARLLASSRCARRCRATAGTRTCT
jgi:hypothetical protein